MVNQYIEIYVNNLKSKNMGARDSSEHLNCKGMTVFKFNNFLSQ